jgi:predicted alpha/beta superfamily hydrolase
MTDAAGLAEASATREEEGEGWIPYEVVYGPDHTVTGTVVVWPSLASGELDRSADVMVYLPPSLGPDGPGWSDGRRYPTLYFHDGQNIFDARTSFAGEWHADETLEHLAREGYEAIAVAIPNGGESRMDEYNPWPSDDIFGDRGQLGGRGDAYLAWLVGSVKALVDRSFPTSSQREATGIIGSSMGGLISLYGLIAQPHVFGLGGVMSPSLKWNEHAVLKLIEDGQLPPARIHLDMGGREGRGMTTDARRLRDLLVARGMVLGRDLQYVEDPGAEHTESAWAERLPDALRFLLAPFRTGADSL